MSEGIIPEASVTTMAQADMRLSESAVANSVGEKQIRIDLSQNEENLIEAKLFVGTPGRQVSLVLDTGSEHMAVASDLCANCPRKPYSLAGSSSKALVSDDTETVVYGSAEFSGKEAKDRTCMAKDDNCVDFKFLAVETQEGMDNDQDGILGLSPEMSTDRDDQHLVWTLMRQGLISRASFSLSLAPEASFAVLGGIDEEQIVGGATGLRPFRNNPDIFSHIKAWALTGTGIYYGNE